MIVDAANVDVTDGASSITARVQKLRDMSPNKRKKMTRIEVEDELSKLGLKTMSDGKSFGGVNKPQLLSILEGFLLKY